MIASFRNGLVRAILSGALVSLSLSAQQPAVDNAAAPASTADDIASLKAQLAEQQKQLEQLRAAIEKQQKAIENAGQQAEAAQAQRVVPAASLGEVASTAPVLPMPAIAATKAPIAIAGQMEQPGARTVSPLSFNIGGATFTPFGFADFISITRSTDVGSGIGTSFGGFPFSNTTAGNLSETHFSMQNSRIGLRVDSVWHDMKVLGYIESDFLGVAPTNPFVTSNSDTLRMRLYFVDLQKGPYEFEAGQTWSLMTPNRKGIGVLPSDVFYTQDVDTNYQLGLTWARQTGVRFTWHPTDHFHWAFALENPEQYVGTALVYPKALATIAPAELDNNSGGVAIPNAFPDFISKIAFDGGTGSHSAHLELVGLLTGVRTYNSLTSGPGAGQRFTKVGGGGEFNFNFGLGGGFRIVSSNYISDGGGRYIGTGLSPDAIVRADGSPSLVGNGSTVDGFEWQAGKKTLLYAYYGGAYIRRNLAFDADGVTPIGYGVTNTLGANRALQEVSFGMQQNFWKSPEYGGLMLAFQYSYLTRNPWDVTTTGQPTNANLNMGYVDLRYTLP